MAEASHWRPQFEASLRVLAKISSEMDSLNMPPPILVGGAAVELYTLSAINTGDFDLVTSRQPELEAVMQKHGWSGPQGHPARCADGFILN